MGGWKEWAVQGCAVVGWIKRQVHDLLERCDHQAWWSSEHGEYSGPPSWVFSLTPSVGACISLLLLL